MRFGSVFVILLLATAPCAVRADDGAPTRNELQKLQRKAFKTLSLPKHAKLVKEIESRLPGGVVIEAAPFDRLVSRLLKEHGKRLPMRERAMRGLAAHPTAKAGKVLEGVLKTLGKEDANRAKWLAEMEAAYADVYNRGYMESSAGARRTRKLAAVLIPFYRTLLAHNRKLRSEAVSVLAAMDTGDARAWLLGTARKSRERALREAAARALRRVGGAEAAGTLHAMVREDASAAVRQRALAALTAWPVKDMKAAILTALGDAAWQVRALAVAMCVRGRLVEAADSLVAALEKEDGRLRKDIDDALFALVGVRMYGKVELWKLWLEENSEKLASQAKALAKEGAYDAPLGPPAEWPAREANEEDADAEKRGGTAAFYGITSLSKRIVFIVDISRSMQGEASQKPPAMGDARDPYARPRGGSKMDIARWQLHRAVNDLPEDAAFNMIVYSESYKVWQAEMTRARSKAVKAAHAFVDRLVANGTTNIGDSLDKALELAGAEADEDGAGGLAADTIYLLSDGDPNRGRVNVLTELLEDFGRRNRRARLVVHTIGIGEAAGSSFLEELAAATGGRYVGFR